MKIDLAKLRKLASAAPQPGPWKRLKDDQPGEAAEYRIVGVNGMWVADVGRDPKDAAFIAACSPDVVLALLDEVERLRAGDQKWAACEEPSESGDRVHACGWTGEMSQLVDRGLGVLHCPNCGSTAIREDITP